MKGILFDIQRFCVYDGPGIRTSVFFKGCNMRCRWCHNPESFRTEPQLMFYAEKCTACGACGDCPQGAHSFSESEGHRIDWERCRACGACAALCPHGALEISGKEMTADEILEEIRKDEKYYGPSGGGVTFSGGEASLQLPLLTELMRRCGELGYHRALETNGLLSEPALKELLPLTDLFLLDYKASDREVHRAWTGVPNDRVLQVLAELDRAGKDVILRCPIIPGVNDLPEHFQAIRKLKDTYACICGVEVMAYHDVGKGKWKALGQPYGLEDLKTVPPAQKKTWEAAIMGDS